MQHRSILFRLIFRFFLFLCLGLGALTAVYCLPNQWQEEHVATSLDYVANLEGNNYSVYFHSNPDALKCDNITHGFMLERVLGDPQASAFYNAVSIGMDQPLNITVSWEKDT